MSIVLYQRRWPHDAGDLPQRLSPAVADVGLGRGLRFSENLQPHGGEHLVVADRDRELVARLRPADEMDGAVVSKNLRVVSTLAGCRTRRRRGRNGRRYWRIAVGAHDNRA